ESLRGLGSRCESWVVSIQEVGVDSDQSSRSPSLCARCGSSIAPGAAFCSHCGLTVTGVAAPPRLPDRPREPTLPREPAPAAAPRADGGAGPPAASLQGPDLVKGSRVMVPPPLIGMGAVFAVGVLLFGSAMGLFAVGGFVGQRPGRTGTIV